MIVNRAYSTNGFHNYYTPSAKDKQKKKKTDASALFKNKKSTGKKATTVRPYLPAVSSNKRYTSLSERTRADTLSTQPITDDDSLSTLSRRSVNSMSINGGGSDYFYNELRSQASIKGDLALSLDKHAELDNVAAWTNSIELEAAYPSPLMNEGLYQKGVNMSSRRRRVDNDFDMPQWVSIRICY